MKKNFNYLDFFKNKDGKWTVAQFPNFLLFVWLFLTLILFFIPDNSLKTSLGQLNSAILFAWSYLEVTDGDSGFRRLLGAVVMLYVIFGFFV